MRRMQRWVVLGAAVVLGGCATPQMTAGDLAKRADQNMLEAQQNLAGKRLIVRGVVKQASLAPRTRTDVSGVVLGRGPVGLMSGTATQTQEQIPVVILEPGSVVCYFEPADIGDAAQLRVGDSTAFECEVKQFENVDKMAVSVLTECRRSK